MEKIQVIQPTKLLAPYIKQYWFLRIDDVKQGFQRSIPAGCVALVFHKGNKIISSFHKGTQPQSYISGQISTYSDIEFSFLDMVIILFQPIGCRMFFPYPMEEFTNQNISIDLLDNTYLVELEEKINEASDTYQTVRLIEEYLLNRLSKNIPCNANRMMTTVQNINEGEGNISVLSQTACLGYKQFKRIFAEYVGLNPKDFIQITRFRKTFNILQLTPQISISKVAYDCGYYDKSHLRSLKCSRAIPLNNYLMFVIFIPKIYRYSTLYLSTTIKNLITSLYENIDIRCWRSGLYLWLAIIQSRM